MIEKLFDLSNETGRCEIEFTSSTPCKVSINKTEYSGIFTTVGKTPTVFVEIDNYLVEYQHKGNFLCIYLQHEKHDGGYYCHGYITVPIAQLTKFSAKLAHGVISTLKFNIDEF